MKEYSNGGVRDTSGKSPFHLLTYEMLEGISNALVLGMKKGYPKDNWKKGLSINEACLAPALRHIYKYIGGEDLNIEKCPDGTTVSCHHLENALCNIAMAVHFIKSNRKELDDRAHKVQEKEEAVTILSKETRHADTYLKTISTLPSPMDYICNGGS